MGTVAGVGWSNNRNPEIAATEAVDMAKTKSGSEKPDFVFLFSTVGYDQERILKTVRENTGFAPLSGCSGEGIVARNFIDESNFSIAVILIKSDEMCFNNGICKNLIADPEGAGIELAENVNVKLIDTSKGLFMFPDFHLNFDRIFTSFKEKLKFDGFFPVWGAVASDNFKFKKSYQYYNDEISTDGISWAMISGDIEVKSAAVHGCLPVGTEHTITKCEGNIIHEIDGKRADLVIADYLSDESFSNWDRSHTLAELYPGFIVEDDKGGEKSRLNIRAILGGRNSATGSIIIPSEFTKGTRILMMRRDPDEIKNSFDTVIRSLKDELKGEEPKIIFHFECAGRGKIILREQIRKAAIEKLQNSFNSDVPWIGFYCLGEIAPIKDRNYFHNSTTVIAAII